MLIRKIQDSDLENLSILFDKYRIFYEKESDLKAAFQFLKERFENKESTVFVAENSENELVGFVQLYPIFSSTRLKRMWLLNDLFVLDTQRGKGISVSLINKSKALCIKTKACGLTLETAKTNTIGNNLYPKTGFKVDKENNYYFWNSNDGI